MKKPKRRCVTVAQTQRLSMTMQRIVFSGDELVDFPEVKPGAYIKFLFKQDGSAVTKPLADNTDIMMRTYTVRAFDRQALSLVVDFVLHGGDEASGPASRWVESASVGDKICIAGPGSIKDFPTQYDWVLFAGDMTALPAIESQLALLPEDTTGFALIAANHASDIRDIAHPRGVKVTWLTDASQRLANCLNELELPDGKPAIWAASEFSQMRDARFVQQSMADSSQ